MNVTLPDGTVLQDVPDGTTKAELLAKLSANGYDVSRLSAPQTAPAQSSIPVSTQIGTALNDIPRQVGLTARYGLEGLAQGAQIFTEPLRYVTDKLMPDRTQTMSGMVAGAAIPPKSVPLSVLAAQLADSIGLPKPQSANERVVGDATRALAGTAGLVGAAGKISNASTGALSQVMDQLAANPLQQFTSAVGGGGAGGASREAGGNEVSQILATLAGGVGGGLVPGAADAAKRFATRAANVAKNEVGMGASNASIDAKIQSTLAQTGVDYSKIPERLRQNMRQDMQGALNVNGDLDPAAVARLMDFRRVGATPTQGMISQNPVQITREMNLAKTGANSSDNALHGLALTQNQNNKTLINRLNDAGATGVDMHGIGQGTIDAIRGADNARQAAVTGLYDRARSMPGGDIQLDRKSLVDNIYGALGQENKLAFLPSNVSDMIDMISAGQVTRNGQTFPVPFDPKALDNLMTVVAKAQRSNANDGNARAALAVVRKAIDSTPITPIKPVVGGNQVVTGETAQALTSADAAPQAVMDALNEARKAAAQRFAWQESSAPIAAALDGVQPDKFVKTFVINGSLHDLESLASHANPEALKSAVLAHLKDTAINSAEDGMGKFSQSAYNRALKAIGDRKLSVLFEPEEVENLKAVGRVASAMQVQPVGSAVNNSNSGAMLIGKGYDAAKALVGMVPGLGHIGAGMLDLTLGNPTRSAANWAGQRAAMDLTPGLVIPVQPRSLIPSMILPAAAEQGALTQAADK